MKKFLIKLGIVLASVLLLLYLAFLFVLPNAVDLNKYKADIQKLTKEQTNLNIDFENPRITTTPLLSAGIKANNLKITLPDNSTLLTADSLKGRISLPALLLLNVKVSTAQLSNPIINVDIVDGKSFKVVDAINVILNNTEQEKLDKTVQSTEKSFFNPAWIKINIPKIKITNYNLCINDLKSGDFIKLTGDELLLGYLNGDSASLKTNAELYLNESKKINANIDIDTFLLKQSRLDEEDDEAQRVEIPFLNPVELYKQYDLKANVDSKIKIRTKNNSITSNGYFNADNITFKLAQMQMPESKFLLNARGKKVNIDTDLNLTENENISINGTLKYGKHPKIDLAVKSTQIQLNNVLNIIKAALKSLNIKNDLNLVKADGYFLINSYIKSNFKKLTSSGNIIINNCTVKNAKTNQKIAGVNSFISLDNSVLKFVDTNAIIADTKFNIDGTINNKSVADIKVNMEKMPLTKIFTMFLPDEINKIYSVNSGNINLNADIKGELKNALSTLKLELSDMDLFDNINKINYKNEKLSIDFNSNFKSFTGNIKNKNFKLSMNGANVNCKDFTLNLGDKDIIINPATVTINKNSTVNLAGQIKDYLKNPNYTFDVTGSVFAKDLKQLLGSDLSMYMDEKGSLPINLNITGNKKKQTLKASVEANSDNYITPLHIKNVQNLPTIMQMIIDFKGDRLKIKDTGFYIKNTIQDPKNPDKTTTSLEEVVSVDGTITKLNTSTPNINLIKIKIPKELSASIFIFPQSKLQADGQLFVFGDLTSPRMRGSFNLKNISIPELMLNVDNANSKFEGKDLDVDIKNILVNDSDYNAQLKLDLNPSENIIIKHLNVISNLTDADKLMKVADIAMKYVPQSQTTSNSTKSSNNTTRANIPIIIKDGTIDIKNIKTGNILLTDTTGKISMNNNVFFVKDILTSAFQGKIKGDVSMNLISGLIGANLNGTGLDVEQTLLDAAAMKDTLTGTTDFTANITLKGVTYEEQMKTLKGTVTFNMKNGSLGPFAKIENLILAENIRESSFFKTTIGSVINSLLSFDTTKYNTLKGKLTFKNGITDIEKIESSGDIMATYIFGNFDLLKNVVDVKVRGKLGSQVSNSMGVLSYLNPVNLVKATPGISVVLGKIFFLFTQVVTPDEMNLIPNLGKDISDNNSTKFQVIIRGDVAKPLTLVKSFKWLALQNDVDNAKSFVGTLPAETVPDLASFGITSTNPEEIKKQAKDAVKTKIENSISEETKQNVEKGKKTVNTIKSIFSGDKSKKEETKKEAKQKAFEFLKKQLNESSEEEPEITE